ncbi:hypothetical protein [Streptomonospora salina]|uniref:Uncharacterized protein n=1 Tax=Streptomonospora salina TaxID=104205 RepID=A0A841E9L5_9ACTN|nr:hypothetical protein [Streptomonospora salina]MBB5997788.1 hypothetical protein [Streptomonospora salina]
MPDHPEQPSPEHPRSQPRPERGRHQGGGEFPPGHHAPGGYQLPVDPSEPPPPGGPPSGEEATGAGSADQAPVAGERFRRVEPARRKAIPAFGSKGHWRLWTTTVLFVMFTASWADYLEPTTRAVWHLAFWALLGAAALITAYRERRHGWKASPRWPWPAAAVAGTIATEVLVATVGSAAATIGSVVVLVLGVFLVLMFG